MMCDLRRLAGLGSPTDWARNGVLPRRLEQLKSAAQTNVGFPGLSRNHFKIAALAFRHRSWPRPTVAAFMFA
jgi:hypothetical protein